MCSIIIQVVDVDYHKDSKSISGFLRFLFEDAVSLAFSVQNDLTDYVIDVVICLFLYFLGFYQMDDRLIEYMVSRLWL